MVGQGGMNVHETMGRKIAGTSFEEITYPHTHS